MGTKHGSHERLKLMRNKIGLRIAQLRELKGLSQKQLSEQLAAHGLTVRRETVTQWENGTRDLKTEYIIKLAEFFNVSTDYVLCQSDTPTRDETLQSVCLITGLSLAAIEKLISVKNNEYAPLLSALIESPHFTEMLNKIYNALWCTKSAAKRVIENMSQFEKDYFSKYVESDKLEEAMQVFSSYSDKFVIVPRDSQKTSYLQEAQYEFMEAAKEAVQNVENNHSMDENLLNVADLELRAFSKSNDSVEADNG